MSQPAKLLLILMVLFILYETGNFGAVASTQQLASHINAVQSATKNDNEIVVLPESYANNELRNTEIDFLASGGGNDSSSGGDDITKNVGNILVLPGKDGKDYGKEGLAIFDESMVYYVNPAAYAAIILMRMSDAAVPFVIETAVVPTKTPSPTTIKPTITVVESTATLRPTQIPTTKPTALIPIETLQLPTQTPESPITPTETQSVTPVQSPSATGTNSPVPTSSKTPVPTNSPTQIPTTTATETPFLTSTWTGTPIPTTTTTETPFLTNTWTETPVPTNHTPTATLYVQDTYTKLPTLTLLPTQIFQETYTPEFTPTPKFTLTPRETFTPKSTYTIPSN